MTNTDDLIARFRIEAQNLQNPIIARSEFIRAIDRLTALQDRVSELEGALRDLAEHAALQDREYLSADLNAKLDRARAVLAKGEKPQKNETAG